MKNVPLFYEKRAVVLWKTSRRFVENKPSFCGKSKMDEKASGRGEKEGWGRWKFYERGRGVNISC